MIDLNKRIYISELKILQLIQKPQLRGAEVFTAQLSTHLNAIGHEAIIVALFEGTGSIPFSGKIIQLNGNQNSKYWDVAAWKRLAAIIKQEQPDIIQANAGDTLKYAVFSKNLFQWKQPILFRNASTISLYIKSPFVKRLYHYLFSKTQKIVSVSQASAADFAALYPRFKYKISTVPIGIEYNAGIESKMFQNPFDVYNAVKSDPVFLHVGGFTFEKNHMGLLRIFEAILKKIPVAQLYLLGDGPLKNEVESYIAQKGLTGKVLLKGFQKEPLQWMQKAHVLLLPSHIEGLPGVILEAFYCKLPVVAYDTGGIKEVVVPHKTGYLIQKNDENAFADAAIHALKKDETNLNIIQNAFALVKSEYMNEEVAKEFLNIYNTVLS